MESMDFWNSRFKRIRNECIQLGKIFDAFPKRRDMNGKYVQPVVKILAELAGIAHGFQIRIGGGNDPGVGMNGILSPHVAEGAVLQNLKQFDLGLGREGADLVQKYGAAAGDLEFSGFFLNAPVKAPFS